jgi:uncharacterized protein (TIGR00297 family)
VPLSWIAAAGGLLTLAVGAPTLLASTAAIGARIPMAIAVTLPFAIGARAGGGVSRSGALAGAGVSVLLLAGAGWPAWTMLVVSFVATTLATRAGRTVKHQAGIDEARGGRRAAGNVIANTGVAAGAALFAPASSMNRTALLVLVASLVAATSDSVASEIGKAFGGTTRSIATWRQVPRGTTGGVSVIGTIAAVVAATTMAAIAAMLALVGPRGAVAVAAAAVVASCLEGIVATAFESRGWLDNDGVNAFTTVSAALLACALLAALSP